MVYKLMWLLERQYERNKIKNDISKKRSTERFFDVHNVLDSINNRVYNGKQVKLITGLCPRRFTWQKGFGSQWQWHLSSCYSGRLAGKMACQKVMPPSSLPLFHRSSVSLWWVMNVAERWRSGGVGKTDPVKKGIIVDSLYGLSSSENLSERREVW